MLLSLAASGVIGELIVVSLSFRSEILGELRFSDAEPPPAAGSSPLITAPAVSADGAPSESVVVVALSASLKPSSRALQRLRVVLQRRRQLLFALPTSAIDCA
jgi:hypothetical protein